MTFTPRGLRAFIRSLETARDPLLRLAKGLAREASGKPQLLARELRELTGAGHTAVYLMSAGGELELVATAGADGESAQVAQRAVRALGCVVAKGGAVGAPLISDGDVLGAIVAVPAGSSLLIDSEFVAAVSQLAASVFAADVRLAASRAEARRDPVTGLGNRLAFDEHIAGAVRFAARGGGTVALVMLDADGFKNVNYTHGHAAVYDVLRELARVLLRCVRPHDGGFRLGGDEF